MTEEIATVFANNPGAGRLELGGGSLSDPPFRILVQSPLSIGLRDVESLNSEQVRILATASDSVPGGPFGTKRKISLPRLTTLDSPLLAETLLRCSSDFDGVTTISPAAARILVASLNRGTEIPAWGGLNKAPQLFIGGRNPSRLAFKGSCPALTPELAAEPAKYRGRLSIAGLEELSPQAAAALASFRGTRLELSGPATDNLSSETAAALATFPGTLDMPLTALDSVPLARKYARQSTRTLDGLEVISAAAIPAYVRYDGFFTLRQLASLDSPALAARLIEDSSGMPRQSKRRHWNPCMCCQKVSSIELRGDCERCRDTESRELIGRNRKTGTTAR